MQYSAPSPVIGMKKQLKDMKRFALLLVATLTLTLQGCNDSDGDYARYWAVATVHPLGENNYYFTTDSNRSIYAGDKSRIIAYEPVEGQRAFIWFNYLPVAFEGYDYNVELYKIENILTKEVETVTTPTDLALMGDDPIQLVGWQLGGGYLTLQFAFRSQGFTTHVVHLVNNEATTGEEAPEGYVGLEFRHNARKDLDGHYGYGYASFRLGDFDPQTTGRKGIYLRTRTPEGDVKYISIEPETTGTER